MHQPPPQPSTVSRTPSVCLPSDRLHKKSWQVTLIVLSSLGIYLCLAVGASLTKRPWSDEGWFASPSWNLANRGFMGTTIIESAGTSLLRIEQHTYWVMPLYLVTQAGWFKLLGGSLLSNRLFSIAWGVIALLACFAIVNRLTNRVLPAGLAVALLAIDYLFVDVASFGRMDMMTAALGLAALASYLLLRQRLTWAVFISNTLIACCALTHPNAVIHAGGLLFIIVYLDRPNLRLRHAALAALPYVIGAAAWAGYISQDIQGFRAQFSFNAMQGDRLQGLFHPLTALHKEWVERYRVAFGLGGHSPEHGGPIFLKSFILLAYIFGIVSMFVFPELRKERSSRILLGLACIYFLVQVLFNQKLGYYLVHIIPLYVAILAIVLCTLWSQRLLPRWLLAGVLLSLIFIQVGGTAYRIRLNERKSYRQAVRFIQQHSTAGGLVMGTAAFAFDLGFDGKLIDDTALGYFSGKRADFIIIDEIYEDALAGRRRDHPEAYTMIQQKLRQQYQEAYTQYPYKIYISVKTREQSDDNRK